MGVFITAGPFQFNRVTADKWVTQGRNGDVYELTRQDYVGDEYDAPQDDWGVWDVDGDDWAHFPDDTGYPSRDEAVRSFVRWWENAQAQ